MTRGNSARVAVLLAAVVACAPRDKHGAVANDGRVEVGAPVPAYATTSLGGDSVSLAGQRGKVVPVSDRGLEAV